MPSQPVPPSRFGIVVLAAGSSSRLGEPKQLLRWHGKTLLRRAAETAVEAVAGGGPVAVVLGANADLLIPELADLPVTVVVNPAWDTGMASSLRAGIEVLESSKVEAAVIALCDQPLVTAETLQKLVIAYAERQTPAVTSEYLEGVLGPPCLFARSRFPDLLALEGQKGAKQLLSRLPDGEITRVPFAAGQTDIDTPGDWARFSPSPSPQRRGV